MSGKSKDEIFIEQLFISPDYADWPSPQSTVWWNMGQDCLDKKKHSILSP